MSGHPDKCRACRGSGYRAGSPITETVQGRPHVYTTVKPCDHDWYHDDHGYDPHLDDPLDRHDPRAVAMYEHGYELGQHDLWVLSGGVLGQEHPNARKEPA